MPARSRGRPPHPDVLTPSEWRVLDWLRHGLTQEQIAARRGVTRDAVKYHVANIAGKLGIERSRDLRRWPGVPATSALAAGRFTMDATVSSGHVGPIGQVSLSIRDVARAERFYGTTLGLPHLFTFGDLAFFDCAGTRLYLHRKDESDWRPGSILYFLVEDIHTAQQRLSENGTRFSGTPHVIHTHEATGTEEWMTFFEDSEGNTLALMSRVSPASGGVSRRP